MNWSPPSDPLIETAQREPDRAEDGTREPTEQRTGSGNRTSRGQDHGTGQSRGQDHGTGQAEDRIREPDRAEDRIREPDEQRTGSGNQTGQKTRSGNRTEQRTGSGNQTEQKMRSGNQRSRGWDHVTGSVLSLHRLVLVKISQGEEGKRRFGRAVIGPHQTGCMSTWTWMSLGRDLDRPRCELMLSAGSGPVWIRSAF